MSPSSVAEPTDGANLVPPDIRLVLDRAGIIREVNAAGALRDKRLQSWVGEHWATTVGSVAEPAIRRVIADALAGRVAGYCQVMQRLPSGVELPMEYTAAQAADGDTIIAIGKNLESVRQLESQLLDAQRTSAQQNLQLREVEGRYRLLLEGSNDAVLLLDSLGARLIEANAAGMAALGLGQIRSAADAHLDFAAQLGAGDRQAFESMLALVRTQSTAPGILLHLGPDRSPWFVRATLTTAALETVFLLRLSRAGASPLVIPAARAGEIIDLKAVFARWPHGFVVVDSDGIVLELNDAFLDLAELSSPPMAIGSSLGRWLSRPGANAAVLLGQASRYGFVRSFPTTLHGELGTDTSIEVSIASVSHYDGQRFGVMLCDVSRRLVEKADDVGQIVAQLTRAIGGRTLKQLTRDAVETLERHYVQQALESSKGNRTAAAELLGLSRQSLYAKLARYGLANDAGSTGDGD